MPDQPTVPPAPPVSQNPISQPSAEPPAPSGPTINIGEEYGTARKNLPPAKVVVPAVVAVLIIVAIASFVKRAKPQASGSLDNVAAVEIPGQESTMVALSFTLNNTSDKVLYIHNIQGDVKTASDDKTADAVSSVDFDRYFQIFPALKEGSRQAVAPETKLQPGQSISGTVIVAFPIKLDAFNQRKSVSVVIWPYSQTVPITLTK